MPESLTNLADSFSRWSEHVDWPWVVAIAVVMLAWGLYRLAAHQIGVHVADPEKRHRYRKRAGYTIAFVVAAGLAVAFFEALRELGTVLGFIGAGLAIALREYLASFLAWFYILGQRSISLGSRIEIGEVRGDVIDIGVFKLTLVEVRGEGLGEQSSGRLVTVPNFKLLTDPVYHFTAGTPYVWDEIGFTITFESDWERAREILEEIAGELYEPRASEIEAGFRKLESAYAFRYGVTTPIAYTTVGDSGIVLQLRYLSHVRQRRGNRDRISRELLTRFAAEPAIELAYPTSRVYRTEVEKERTEGEEGGGLPG
ncbi:MAG: mechanosensitive ion channel [Gemmatimonadota bacterium]|nr:mechanosensitive ion channel [Gemmatimonadota bacterium]